MEHHVLLQIAQRSSVLLAFFSFVLVSRADFTGLTYEVVGTSSVGTTYRIYVILMIRPTSYGPVCGGPNSLVITSAAGFYQDALVDGEWHQLDAGLFPNPAWFGSRWTGGQFNRPDHRCCGWCRWNAASLNFEAGGDFIVNDGVGGNVFAARIESRLSPMPWAGVAGATDHPERLGLHRQHPMADAQLNVTQRSI